VFPPRRVSCVLIFACTSILFTSPLLRKFLIDGGCTVEAGGRLSVAAGHTLRRRDFPPSFFLVRSCRPVLIIPDLLRRHLDVKIGQWAWPSGPFSAFGRLTWFSLWDAYAGSPNTSFYPRGFFTVTVLSPLPCPPLSFYLSFLEFFAFCGEPYRFCFQTDPRRVYAGQNLLSRGEERVVHHFAFPSSDPLGCRPGPDHSTLVLTARPFSCPYSSAFLTHPGDAALLLLSSWSVKSVSPIACIRGLPRGTSPRPYDSCFPLACPSPPR